MENNNTEINGPYLDFSKKLLGFITKEISYKRINLSEIEHIDNFYMFKFIRYRVLNIVTIFSYAKKIKKLN